MEEGKDGGGAGDGSDGVEAACNLYSGKVLQTLLACLEDPELLKSGKWRKKTTKLLEKRLAIKQVARRTSGFMSSVSKIEQLSSRRRQAVVEALKNPLKILQSNWHPLAGPEKILDHKRNGQSSSTTINKTRCFASDRAVTAMNKSPSKTAPKKRASASVAGRCSVKRPLAAVATKNIPMSTFFAPLPSVRIPHNLRPIHFLASRSQPPILSPRRKKAAKRINGSENLKSVKSPRSSKKSTQSPRPSSKSTARSHSSSSKNTTPRQASALVSKKGSTPNTEKGNTDQTPAFKINPAQTNSDRSDCKSPKGTKKTADTGSKPTTGTSDVEMKPTQTDSHARTQIPQCPTEKRGSNLGFDQGRFKKKPDVQQTDGGQPHSSQVVRSVAPTSSTSQPRYSTRCRFWEKGHCRNGDNCPFTHIQMEEASSTDGRNGNGEHFLSARAHNRGYNGGYSTRSSNPFGGSLF